MKIILGRQIEKVKKKDSETEKNLLKNRNSDELNELDADDIYFHSNAVKNIKLGTQLVNRIYLNNSIVYDLEDTIALNLFHSLVPAATTTSIIFDSLENQNISNYNLVGYCDANSHIAVYQYNTEYLILNIRNAVNYAPISCANFLSGYKVLTNCIFDNFDTRNTTSTGGMFNGCTALTNLDLSNFNTQNVTNMQGMFEKCVSLTSLDLSSFNTQNVAYMHNMFNFCQSLTSLDLSSFNTANITNMQYMFKDCRSLTSLDLSSFNTQNVADMMSMFQSCVSLVELNITFSCINLSNIYQAFYNCYNLSGTIDMGHCNTPNNISLQAVFVNCYSLEKIILPATINMASMYWAFKDCRRLTTIIANTIVSSSSEVFSGCTSLVGGNGTPYSSAHINAAYARVDGENGLPGYFTAPAANNNK